MLTILRSLSTCSSTDNLCNCPHPCAALMDDGLLVLDEADGALDILEGVVL